MGHLTLKQAKRLTDRLDQNPVGAPGNEVLTEILGTLFTPEEADLAARMPYGFASTGRLSRMLGIPAGELGPRLDRMAEKGLVMDMRKGDKVWWYLSPLIIGFFEFTMMRIRTDVDQKALADLMHRYLFDDPRDAMLREAIAGDTQLMRPMAHEDALDDGVVEVLDWDRASHLVNSAKAWGVGLCHCRHVEAHRGNACHVPQEMCLTLGPVAQMLIRRGIARAIEKEEALDILAQARDLGLVHMGDNVRKGAAYICNCCSCCCGMLEGYRRLRETSTLQTSNYIVAVDRDACTHCGKCAKACPVAALSMEGQGKDGRLRFEEDVCLGCAVCVRSCKFGALNLRDRPSRTIPPEHTLERVVRMAVERGKLQTLIFDEPDKLTHKVLRGVLGAILALPPAKQALANQQIKSRFVQGFLRVAKYRPGSDAV
ncbi:MAG: 4Fe-4S binding protein [Pseudomonadota bacterium]